MLSCAKTKVGGLFLTFLAMHRKVQKFLLTISQNLLHKRKYLGSHHKEKAVSPSKIVAQELFPQTTTESP